MACSRSSLRRLVLPHDHRVHKISYYLESVTENIIGWEKHCSPPYFILSHQLQTSPQRSLQHRAQYNSHTKTNIRIVIGSWQLPKQYALAVSPPTASRGRWQKHKRLQGKNKFRPLTKVSFYAFLQKKIGRCIGARTKQASWQYTALQKTGIACELQQGTGQSEKKTTELHLPYSCIQNWQVLVNTANNSERFSNDSRKYCYCS